MIDLISQHVTKAALRPNSSNYCPQLEREAWLQLN